MAKRKILLISDDLRAGSGVGCQARYLALGLVNTGKYTVRQLGAAIKHPAYSVEQVHEDILVKPIDGFGDRDLYRQLLITERPDVTVIFNDPRFFSNLFEVEDEFHQVCPIVYNHLWDQLDFPPMYNRNMLDTVDCFCCINRPTYEFCRSLYGDQKVRWAPHALPKELFHPMKESDRNAYRDRVLPGRRDHFVVGWCSRNAHRKRPGDVMWSFKMFLDRLRETEGHSKATLVMHTDPLDKEGPNLLHIVDLFKMNDNVVFSREQLDFPSMNALYNACDCTIALSYAEGFGLSVLESMYCGRPVIAVRTGGLERQVVDWRDGSENGIALAADCKKLVGSQETPYIVEDLVKPETAAEALWRMYSFGPEERKRLGEKARLYATSEFDLDTLIRTWDDAIEWTLANWRANRPRWSCKEVR